MPRRFTPRFLVVPAALLLLAACGGSPGATAPDDTAGEHATSASPARAASLPVTEDEADLAPAATVDEPAYNDLWGVEASENIIAGNNLGQNANGACSGRGAAQGEGCAGSWTSLKRLLMPSLSVSSPSGDAAATASASSEAALGLLKAAVAVTADFNSPYSSESSSFVTLSWTDAFTPPAATKRHPAGSIYKLEVTMTLSDDGEALDCADVNTATYEAQLDVGSSPAIVGGCSPSGTSPARVTVDATWGGPAVNIGSSLSVAVQASAATASWATSLPAIKTKVKVTAPSGVAYTTASGKCYGDSGECS